MSKNFKVELVTPEGVIVDKEVEEIIAPGVMGEFGVLVGHTPMLTFLKPGLFSYLEGDKFVKFVVGAGFCEVLKDGVSVLVEEAHSVEKLDPSKATAEMEDLDEQLKNIDPVEEPEKFEQVAARAKVARIKVAAAVRLS